MTTPDWKLACFDWLDIGKWDVERLLTAPIYQVEGKQYCKVCDALVEPKDGEKHVREHVKEEKARRNRSKKEGEVRRKEGLKAYRLEKKLEKEVR